MKKKKTYNRRRKQNIHSNWIQQTDTQKTSSNVLRYHRLLFNLVNYERDLTCSWTGKRHTWLCSVPLFLSKKRQKMETGTGLDTLNGAKALTLDPKSFKCAQPHSWGPSGVPGIYFINKSNIKVQDQRKVCYRSGHVPACPIRGKSDRTRSSTTWIID